LHGWVILDKPTGITSAHAVAKVKRLLKPMKIGHAGTLDPLASGVLPLALGEATKTMPYVIEHDKKYLFTATWGQARDTDDMEGQITATSELRPSREAIEALLPHFTGTILQAPPSYSAIKIDGKRAYDLARSGQNPEMKPREVTVYKIEIVDYNQDATVFSCHCGKGTYIRSIARDMGQALGCFGTISALRRTQVGKFGLEHAISLELLADMVHKSDRCFVQPVEFALDDIPARNIDSDQALLLKRGHTIPLPSTMEEPGAKILARHDGKVVAICEAGPGTMKPVRVFNL